MNQKDRRLVRRFKNVMFLFFRLVGDSFKISKLRIYRRNTGVLDMAKLAHVYFLNRLSFCARG